VAGIQGDLRVIVVEWSACCRSSAHKKKKTAHCLPMMNELALIRTKLSCSYDSTSLLFESTIFSLQNNYSWANSFSCTKLSYEVCCKNCTNFQLAIGTTNGPRKFMIPFPMGPKPIVPFPCIHFHFLCLTLYASLLTPYVPE
jgi:hypothetical protein